MKQIIIAVVATVILVLAACSNVEKKPESLLAKAELSLDQARSAEAPKDAPAVYNEAEQHLKLARQLIEENEYEEAARALEKSVADSRYAIAKSNSVKSEKAAKQITENLRVLQEETERQ